MLATSREHFLLIDRDKRYRFARTSALRAIGVPASRLAGRAWRELGLPPERMVVAEVHYLGQGAQGRLDGDTATPLLDIDRAVPLGLIINELVTNAFKHGLAVGAFGQVKVKVRAIADGRWRMIVADDGRGSARPASRANDGRGLGLKLVEIFAEQLGGTVRICTTPNYRGRIDFRLAR